LIFTFGLRASWSNHWQHCTDSAHLQATLQTAEGAAAMCLVQFGRDTHGSREAPRQRQDPADAAANGAARVLVVEYRKRNEYLLREQGSDHDSTAF
jgi:hypothetical protein